MHSSHQEMSAGPKRPPLPIKEFFLSALEVSTNFQKKMRKYELMRTALVCILFTITWITTQTKITYTTIHI